MQLQVIGTQKKTSKLFDLFS